MFLINDKDMELEKKNNDLLVNNGLEKYLFFVFRVGREV